MKRILFIFLLILCTHLFSVAEEPTEFLFTEFTVEDMPIGMAYTAQEMVKK